MDIFNKIAERKILEAMNEGMFENLSGQGKPLVFEDETWIPEDLRMAYRFLKNSGCIPPELELRKEIVNLKSLMDTIDDDEERLKKLRQFNYKIMQFNIVRKRPFHLEDFPGYDDKIVERMISGSSE
jgi:hypothetical protein